MMLAMPSGANLLSVPSKPAMGNWIGLCLFAVPGFITLLYDHRTTAMVLVGLGAASLLSPVTYWEFDKSANRLKVRSCNAIYRFSAASAYPLDTIRGVSLELKDDLEGGYVVFVRLEMDRGDRIQVSSDRADALRIAEFLGIELTTINT